MGRPTIDPDEPVVVERTNHGIDGWDARTDAVAFFETARGAVQALRQRGFMVTWDGKPQKDMRGPFYHTETSRRHTMGAISYGLRPRAPLPVNRLPEREGPFQEPEWMKRAREEGWIPPTDSEAPDA